MQQPDEGFVDEGEAPSVWVRGLYDYKGTDTSALSFQKGAIIEVFNQLETGWWDGVLDDERGWFPSNYVQLLTPRETEAHLAALYDMSVQELHNEQFLDPQPQQGPSHGQNGHSLDQLQHGNGSNWDTDESGWGSSTNNGQSDYSSRDTHHSVRPKSIAADDFWMPQVSADGQIYYRNSKTGETSRDMPMAHSSVVDSAIELDEPALVPPGPSLGGGYQSAYDILRARERTTSSSRPAEASVTTTWVKRLADDGISHYWFNTATGQAQWHEPAASELGSSAASTSTAVGSAATSAKTKSRQQMLEDEYESDDAAYAALRKGFANIDVDSYPLQLQGQNTDGSRRISVYSDGSDVQSLSDTQQFSTGSRRPTRNRAQSNATPAQPQTQPLNTQKSDPHNPAYIRAQEALAAQNAQDLQAQLAPQASETFADLAVVVKRAIAAVVDSASPTSANSNSRSHNGSNPNDPAQVMDRVSAIVIAVRNLLYTSGTLAAPLSSLLPQTGTSATSGTGATDASESSRALMLAESSRSPMIELRPYQRKVTATLSKLVLSARATKSNLTSGSASGGGDGGGSAGPAFDARVDLDAAELDRAITMLVNEIQAQRAAVAAAGITSVSASASGRTKRLHGVFDSPGAGPGVQGQAGVGLGVPGGGVGGMMRGLGFVNDDGAMGISGLGAERVSLRRGVEEDMEGFVTRVEECLAVLEGGGAFNLQAQGPLAVTELSALLAFVEDIDVASHLDISGSRAPNFASATDTTNSTSNAADDYFSSVRDARPLLRQLEWSKQAIFDEGMLLLMLCEGERTPSSSSGSASFYSNGLHSASSPSLTQHSQHDRPHSQSRSRPTTPASLHPHPYQASQARGRKERDAAARARAAPIARSLRAHIRNVQNEIERLVALAERQASVRRAVLSATSAALNGNGNGNGHGRMIGSDLDFDGFNVHINGMNGIDGPVNENAARRDSMILPTIAIAMNGDGVVDRPDSPLRRGSDPDVNNAQGDTLQLGDAHAAAVRLMLEEDGLGDGGDGDGDGEFVDMADAFSAPRRAPPTASTSANAISAAAAPAKIGGDRDKLGWPPAPAPPTTGNVNSPAPPSYRTRAESPDLDSDEDDAPKLPRPSPARRGQSNKLYKLLGEEIPAEKPWYLQPAYNEKELLFAPDGEVRGGTLPALVERLTYHYAADTAFNEAFLITFKSFTTPADLIDQLTARFEKQPPEGLRPEEAADWKRNWQDPVRGRIINTMRRLLVEDDCITGEDRVALEKMHAFVSKHEPTYPGVKMVAGTLSTLMSTGTAPTRKLSKTVPIGAPPPILPKQNPSKKLKFLDMDPTEVARQLTLMESELFCKIRGTECLARAEGGQADNDNIKAVISMSNKIADWVNEAVLAKEDPRKRALLIKHFILITDKCRSMNNFSTMAALVAALNSPPIRRLKRSWDQINSRHISMLDDIENLMQAGKSLPDYRAMLSRVTLPCIPFIGVYLTTLTFIQDGMKDNLVKEGGVINFMKRAKASAIITEIKKYQSSPYNLVPVEVIRSFLENALKVDRPQDFYWELSLQREPRERDDEKMARLLQESGFL